MYSRLPLLRLWQNIDLKRVKHSFSKTIFARHSRCRSPLVHTHIQTQCHTQFLADFGPYFPLGFGLIFEKKMCLIKHIKYIIIQPCCILICFIFIWYAVWSTFEKKLNTLRHNRNIYMNNYIIILKTTILVYLPINMTIFSIHFLLFPI